MPTAWNIVKKIVLLTVFDEGLIIRKLRGDGSVVFTKILRKKCFWSLYCIFKKTDCGKMTRNKTLQRDGNFPSLFILISFISFVKISQNFTKLYFFNLFCPRFEIYLVIYYDNIKYYLYGFEILMY